SPGGHWHTAISRLQPWQRFGCSSGVPSKSPIVQRLFHFVEWQSLRRSRTPALARAGAGELSVSVPLDQASIWYWQSHDRRKSLKRGVSFSEQRFDGDSGIIGESLQTRHKFLTILPIFILAGGE